MTPLPIPGTERLESPLRPPRQAERLAGDGLVLVTGTRLFDRGTMAVRCPGIRNQAGDPAVAVHPEDAARLDLADGALCEVRSARGVLRLAVRLWPGLRPGHAYIPRGYDAAPVNALLDEAGPVTVSLRALAAAAAAG